MLVSFDKEWYVAVSCPQPGGGFYRTPRLGVDRAVGYCLRMSFTEIPNPLCVLQITFNANKIIDLQH